MTGAIIGAAAALAVGYVLGMAGTARRVRRLMSSPGGRKAMWDEFAPGDVYLDMTGLPDAEKVAAIGGALGLPLELRKG